MFCEYFCSSAGMNQDEGISAREWLKTVTVEELAWVIHSYGEDDDSLLAERIAETILAKQRDVGGEIKWTTQLSDIVKMAKSGANDGIMHPAKLTFQSIRVFLNQEMQQLDHALCGAMENLVHGGRISVISFKRKESNAINRLVRLHEEPDHYLRRVVAYPRLCELYPLITTDKNFSVRQLGEPIRPLPAEVERNRRSRSSAVHVLQKVSREYPLQQNVPVMRSFIERFQEPPHPQFRGGAIDTNVLKPSTIQNRIETQSAHEATKSSAPTCPPSGPQTKFGDWTCRKCGDHQFSRNANCRTCGAPRNSLGNTREYHGDWICSNCSDLQFARNTVCRRCGNSKSSTNSSTVRGSSQQNQDQLVARVKTFQQRGEAQRLAWTRYCDERYGVYDPERHEIDSLKAFLLQHDRHVSTPTPVDIRSQAVKLNDTQDTLNTVELSSSEPHSNAERGARDEASTTAETDKSAPPDSASQSEDQNDVLAKHRQDEDTASKVDVGTPGPQLHKLGRVEVDFGAGGDGYLVLKRGDTVRICYQGMTGDEAGWYYGFMLDSTNGGWFPAPNISLIAPDEAG